MESTYGPLLGLFIVYNTYVPLLVNKEGIFPVAKGNRGEYRRVLVKGRNTILGVKDKGKRIYNRGALEASRKDIA